MTSTTTTGSKKWNDEAVDKLTALTSGFSPVPGHIVESAAVALGVTVRSVAAKLRQLGVEVESMAQAKVSAFSAEQTNDLREFLFTNAGALTYKEIAEQFADGAFGAKQVQGKILALEMTDKVKPTEKVEFARTYTEAEETKFIKMANDGKFIEDISEALGKTIASVRGKALSLSRSGEIKGIPAQKASYATTTVDPVAALGDSIATMTLAQIAVATDKTERGVKTLLTRRGIDVADYKGHAKREKADAKLATPAAA
jgi:hypothetical protein